MLPRRIPIFFLGLSTLLPPRQCLRQWTARRLQSNQPSYEPPTAPQQGQPVNPHRAFYQSFGVPFAKVFLGALFTYQIIYWSWLKLESLEVKRDKDVEIKILEAKVEELRERKNQGNDSS